MTILLNAHELAMFAQAPEDDLVDLSIELDVVVPDEIDRAQLLSACVLKLQELAQREGLPLSEYDREDLEKLPAAELSAFAKMMGVDAQADPTLIDRVLKAGKKVYKRYRKYKPRSPVPMYLPMLLAPLARKAADGDEHDG